MDILVDEVCDLRMIFDARWRGVELDFNTIVGSVLSRGFEC
jgi:hypothetical protein